MPCGVCVSCLVAHKYIVGEVKFIIGAGATVGGLIYLGYLVI